MFVIMIKTEMWYFFFFNKNDFFGFQLESKLRITATHY